MDDILRHFIDYGLEQEDLSLSRIPEKNKYLKTNNIDSKNILKYFDNMINPSFKEIFPIGYEPRPFKLEHEPLNDDPLPKAEYLVVTWTIAEHKALNDILAPGINRNSWYRYKRNFENEFKEDIRNGAPSIKSNRLGSYYLTKIGEKIILLFKSELHLNQDGKKTDEGKATLPIKNLWKQIIEEVKPKLVISIGTAGATFLDHELGDVIITRASKFKLLKEFRNESFNNHIYKSKYKIKDSFFLAAKKIMNNYSDKIQEPLWLPPTKHYIYTGSPINKPNNVPDIKVDGKDFPEYHPMLTTDYFEYGTSLNHLDKIGCGVEMGDAVLGLVCEELNTNSPEWLIIRNASDPQINGDLPILSNSINTQIMYAVWYYETYGYWTSVNSAVACWSVIAGD